MRQFVVVGHDAPTTDAFSLDALPGAGRVDLLARCVLDALLTSHGIREDVRVHLVLEDTVTVRFDGGALRNLHPDERSAAALIRSALAEHDELVGHQPVAVGPGLSLVRQGFDATLDAVAAAGPLVFLTAEGRPASTVDPPTDPVFVCSDHLALTDAEHEALSARESLVVSLGPIALHADQAITVAHNWLDTDGFSPDADT